MTLPLVVLEKREGGLSTISGAKMWKVDDGDGCLTRHRTDRLNADALFQYGQVQICATPLLDRGKHLQWTF